MSLMKTLAKVAIGVAVAKGASSMMNRNAAGSGGGLGGLLGGMSQAGAGGGMQDMLGGLLGGAGGGLAGGQMGGLGGLLEQLGGGSGGAQGGLQDMLGGLAGAGGMGGLMGALAGKMQQQPAQNNASFGAVLNSAFDQTPEPAIDPTPDQEAAAGLMLRAMIQAAKSDGQLDDGEQEKLMGQLGGDIDAQEAAFLREEMGKPVDVNALVSDAPRGMGPQIYAVSLLAIDLDNQAEAQYLHSLAQGFGMAPEAVNDIHNQLGVPTLYN